MPGGRGGQGQRQLDLLETIYLQQYNIKLQEAKEWEEWYASRGRMIVPITHHEIMEKALDATAAMYRCHHSTPVRASSSSSDAGVKEEELEN